MIEQAWEIHFGCAVLKKNCLHSENASDGNLLNMKYS